MRASTLFALTIAILIGLGVAVAARVSGFFQAPVAVAQPEIKVLVAAKNLFKGDVIDSTGIQVRTLRPEEIAVYQKNKASYLPPVATAAQLRIAKNDILADQPITKDNLEPLVKPEPLNTRLMKDMRAVSVSLTKDQSAGGMISVGEWVDVLLTSSIEDPSGRKTVRTAPIASAVRVVAKRNTLWPVFAPLPKDEKIQFTLEVNPYRAGLIEFGKSKGEITLTPLPVSEQKRLEGQRTTLLKQPNADVHQVLFQEEGSVAVEEEKSRINAYQQGELSVGDSDLMRIFGISTTPPPVKNITIQQIGGLSHYQPAEFTMNGDRVYPTRAGNTNSSNNSPAMTAGGFQFTSPAAGCKTCGTKRKKG